MPVRLRVALDGNGDYSNIQAAIMACAISCRYPTIFIKNGTYHEKLLVPSQKNNITLLGESTEGVIITYGDYSGDAAQHTTYTSATVRV